MDKCFQDVAVVVVDGSNLKVKFLVKIVSKSIRYDSTIFWQ